MGKNVNVSIVLFNSEFSQIDYLVKELRLNESINQIYLIDNSLTCSNLYNSSNVTYIFNGKNLGFGAGHNIAINKTINEGIKYHLVLNPDIIFKHTVINKMIVFLEDNFEVGLMMPKILYPNGEVQYLPKLLPTPFQLIKRKLVISKKLHNKLNYLYEMRGISDDKSYEVPIISGCFSLFRIDALKKVGLYDERFFMYFEDFDISRRMHKYFKTIYFPMVSIFHDYGRGAQKNYKLFLIFIKSAIIYFNKWGWIFDKERKEINGKVTSNFR
jgi:GT2 family glycosyltransferase